MNELLVNDEWIVVEFPEFSIKFPMAPVAQNQAMEPPYGGLEKESYILDGSLNDDVNSVYSIIKLVLPLQIERDGKETLEEFYKLAINGAVNSVNGVLLSEEDFFIDEYLGKELIIDFHNDYAKIKTRILIIGNILINTQTITLTEKFDNRKTLKFHDSLMLK